MTVLRTYARVHTTDLDQAIAGLEVLGSAAGPRIQMSNGLTLVSAGRVLIVAGDEETLRPFASTSATLIVDSLDDVLGGAAAAGAVVVHEPQWAPTGVTATVRFGDVAVELVEWSPAQWERVRDSDPAGQSSPSHGED